MALSFIDGATLLLILGYARVGYAYQAEVAT